MLSLDENRFSANIKPAQKIQTLIIGRLLIVFLLFAVKWMWNSGYKNFSFNVYPRGIFPVLPVRSLRYLLDKHETRTLSAQMRSNGD